MKTKLLLLAGAIMLFSTAAQAATVTTKYTISGEPYVVTQSGDYYVLPDTATYTTTSDYYYVNVADKKRVCYRDVQPSLASVGLLDLKLKLGNDTVAVHCYDYSPDYFIVK